MRPPVVKQSADFSCGCATLLSVLQGFGGSATEQELCVLLKTSDSGTEQDAFKKVAKSKGLVSVALTNNSLSDLEKALRVGMLVIADLQLWEDHDCKREMMGEYTSGHYVVVFALDDDYVYFMDPWPGEYCKISRSSFKKRWHNRSRGMPFESTAIYFGKKRTL